MVKYENNVNGELFTKENTFFPESRTYKNINPL